MNWHTICHYARGNCWIPFSNPNCTSNRLIHKLLSLRAYSRKVKALCASKCRDFMITLVMNWSIPPMERIGEHKRHWGQWDLTAQNTLLCLWRSAGRKAFRHAISKDCCIWIRKRTPSQELNMRGRMFSFLALAGVEWTLPWDEYWSTARLILPTIRQIILSLRWGQTHLCCGVVVIGHTFTGQGPVPRYGYTGSG